MSWSPDNKPNMNVERGEVISKTPREILLASIDKLVEDAASTMTTTEFQDASRTAAAILDNAIHKYGRGPYFDAWGNRVNPNGSLWNLDGKLAARNGND